MDMGSEPGIEMSKFCRNSSLSMKPVDEFDWQDANFDLNCEHLSPQHRAERKRGSVWSVGKRQTGEKRKE